MIIDSHTHVGSHLYKIYKGMYPSVNNVANFLELLNKKGIEKAITFPMGDTIYYNIDTKGYTNFNISGLCDFPYEIENKNMINDIEMFDLTNVLYPFAIIHPNEKIKEQLIFLKPFFENKKLFGIKMHCGFINTPILDIDKPEIIDFVKKYNIPILLHTDDDVEIFYAKHVYYLSKKYQDINFCVAHMGKFVKYFWGICKINGIPKNLFIDTSPFILITKFVKQFFNPSIHLEENYDDIKGLFLKYTSLYQDNILWGSDEPFTSFRNASNSNIPIFYKGNIDENINLLNYISPNIKEKIAFKNTMRFLNIN